MEEKYKKLYESSREALVTLQKEVLELQRINSVLEAEKRQWQAEKMIQQTIVNTAIGTANATSNQYLEELRELREEIRRLKNGNIDRLGN